MDRNMKLGFHLCNESHFQEDGNGMSESMGRKPHNRLVAYKVPNKFPQGYNTSGKSDSRLIVGCKFLK